MESVTEMRRQKILSHINYEEDNNEAIIFSIMNNFSKDYYKNMREEKLLNLQLKISKMKQRKEDNTLNFIDSKKTRIMSSLVPDEIIYNFDDYTKREYNAALMFADISGFTELSEKYSATGKDGTSRMTQILNSYIGSMVQEILSHNGDLLKFSGDAFLAMWKSTQQLPMQNAVHTAIDCALVIQRDYGAIETDVGIILKVKVAISGGRVLFTSIGNKENSHYAVVGQPVWDVKKAEYLSKAGDVIASPSAWKYVNSAQYITKPMNDGIHTNVLGVGATWRHVHILDEATSSVNSEMDESSLDETNKEFYYQNYALLLQAYTDKNVASVRRSVNYSIHRNLHEKLRCYIMTPVMKAIENDEPMEYLTEMRYIVILFLNVIANVSNGFVLLDTVNLAYNDVCSVVSKSNGIVNKVSLFDKDMMFLIVFGLRGLKHEMEKQRALRCAVELRNVLYKHDQITSVSIGVTSGPAYCGIVGHKLRREYTVIGLCVNKGARLMVAYPNKITCDKEVFLQSKLNASSFKLLKFKVLKGLSDVGPIYEYDADTESIPDKTDNTLMGRNNEIQKFTIWLDALLDQEKHDNGVFTSFDSNCNIFIIQGEATVGKLLLFEEMLKLVPPFLNICRISLNKSENNANYNILRRIVDYGIEHTSTTSHVTEEEKIQAAVGSSIRPMNLCFLNSILQTKFTVSDFYIESTENNRHATCRDTFRKLCRKIFSKTLVLFAIHKAEYIDDLSWSFLLNIMDSKHLATILTIEQDSATDCSRLKNVLANPKTTVLTLSGVNQWYHSAIICQTLDVQAISPDLEMIVQAYSQGVIGWIQKFIQILIQSGQLSIRMMSSDEALALGAVVPITEDLRSLTHVNSDFNSFSRFSRDICLGWSMFESSYKMADNDTNSTNRSANQKMRVAILEPTYSFDSMHIQLTSNVTFLKTYDTLTPFEKLQLKCSSALGEIFSRTLLLNVLRCQSDKQAATGFAKLFDIGFLECAGGDFTQEQSGIFIRPLLEKSTNTKKKCHCVGININDNYGLPPYAWCGYMRFCNTMFFTYAYDLLTENQKIDFHNRAISYLEKNIQKCSSCGGGNFKKLLGIRTDIHGEKYEISDSFGEYLNDGGFNFQYFKSSDAGLSAAETKHQKNTCTKNIKPDVNVFNLGNFLSCECEVILGAMYTQIIEHCRKTDEIHKLLEAYIEYAELKINGGNIQEAMVVLTEVHKYVQSPKFQLPENNKRFSAWQKNFVFGRIASTRGRALLEYGDMQEGYRHLVRAMSLFGCSFPTSRNKVKIKLFIEKSKQSLALEMFSELYIGKVTGIEGTFMDQVAQTLTYLFTYFMSTEDYQCAYLAAVWSLNFALKLNRNFTLLCVANGNMITIGKRYNKLSLCRKIEACALRMCDNVTQPLDLTEIYAVSHLFTSIFLFRIGHVNIESGMEIGYHVLKILNNSKAKYNKTKVLIGLGGVLCNKRMYFEALKIYKILIDEGKDQDVINKTWYYSKVMDIHLDCGYTVEKYESYCKFYLECGENIIHGKNPQAGWHFIINLWVRALRTKEWDITAIWFEKAQKFSQILFMSHVYLLTSLRYFEGLMLSVVSEMDKKNELGYSMLLKTLKKTYDYINKTVSKNTMFLPRFYFLKAYYYHVLDNGVEVVNYLNKCRAAGVKGELETVLTWCNHAEKAWSNTLSPLERDHWVVHSKVGNEIFLSGIETSTNKFIPYTHPSPQYRFN